MSGEIKIGPKLLDYSETLRRIYAKIAGTKATFVNILRDLESGDVYEGRALEEMKTFFYYYAQNIEKLLILYEKACQYVVSTYEEHYHNEKDIILWVINSLKEDQESRCAGMS